MARIIDLSAYQAVVDFRAVKKSGVAGVWIKLTEGVSYVDAPNWVKGDDTRVAWLATRVKAIRAAGLRVGFYHFARPDHNRPSAEAANFASVASSVGGIGRRDLRPVLDLECSPVAPAYVPWSRVWNKAVKNRLDVGPLFYSYGPYIDALHSDAPIGYGLWLASYGRNDGLQHAVKVPAPWKRYAAHQFTSQGAVPGMSGACDVSYVPFLPRVLAHPVAGLV